MDQAQQEGELALHHFAKFHQLLVMQFSQERLEEHESGAKGCPELVRYGRVIALQTIAAILAFHDLALEHHRLDIASIVL